MEPYLHPSIRLHAVVRKHSENFTHASSRYEENWITTGLLALFQHCVSNLDSCSGGPELRFVAFFSSSREMLGRYLKEHHDRLLPHPSQFIIRNDPLILLYTSYTVDKAWLNNSGTHKHVSFAYVPKTQNFGPLH